MLIVILTHDHIIVSRGWPKADASKNCREQHAAGLRDVDKQRTATNNAKGGTPAYRSVNVDPSEESVQYTQYQYTEGNETITATEFSILPTTAAGLAASENKNVAACVLKAMQLPKQDSNKKATTLLKFRLQKLGMKMDPRVIDGRSADDKTKGWENRGLRFYFKGKCSDVTENQVKLEPAKPPAVAARAAHEGPPELSRDCPTGVYHDATSKRYTSDCQDGNGRSTFSYGPMSHLSKMEAYKAAVADRNARQAVVNEQKQAAKDAKTKEKKKKKKKEEKKKSQSSVG